MHKFRFAAVTLVGLACITDGALANRRPCLELEQSYLQIERYASSVELNIKLFDAARRGCDALAERLLEKGASLEARDGTGSRPLARAAASGQQKIVTLFLTKGAAIDARDLDGSTALFKAAENGRMAIVRLLVEAGANVNLPGRSDVSPVAAGAFMGSEPIVRYLIENGADLNGLDKTGKGPLVYAVGRGFPPVTRTLARSWRRRECALRRRPDRADVGGRSFGRRRHQGRGPSHKPADRSRREAR